MQRLEEPCCILDSLIFFVFLFVYCFEMFHCIHISLINHLIIMNSQESISTKTTVLSTRMVQYTYNL